MSPASSVCLGKPPYQALAFIMANCSFLGPVVLLFLVIHAGVVGFLLPAAVISAGAAHLNTF